MSITVAVTGASGYLGNVLIRKLLAKKVKIRAFVHNHDEVLQNLDLTLIKGDVRNVESVRELIRGCDIVYHCAAYISIVSYDKKQLFDVNLQGTRNIIIACEENNAKLIYISSIEAVGKIHEKIHNEDDGFNPPQTLIQYGMSKSMASIEVLKASKEKRINSVIICPTGIIGPFEHGTSPLGKMVRDFISKKLIASIAKGGFCFVDVRDVADVAIMAGEKKEKIEGHYIVSGEYLEISDMMRILHEVSGVRPPFFSISLFMLHILSIFIEPMSYVLKTNPIFTSGSFRVLASRLHVRSKYLKRDFNIIPRLAKDSLRDQVLWYKGGKVQL